MNTYEKLDNPYNPSSPIIKMTAEDGTIWFIPTDPANSDYQAYLATLAANSAPQANSTES